MGCGCGGSTKPTAPPPRAASGPREVNRQIERVVDSNPNPQEDPGYYWNGPVRPAEK